MMINNEILNSVWKFEYHNCLVVNVWTFHNRKPVQLDSNTWNIIKALPLPTKYDLQTVQSVQSVL